MKSFNRIRTRLAGGGIVLSLVDISSVRERVERDGIEAFPACLSPGESARAESMRFMKRRSDFISGRLAAKLAVAEHLSRRGAGTGCRIDGLDEIDIRRLESGEPAAFFRGAPLAVSVSISHSGSMAVSGAAGNGSLRGIGVDIEKIEERSASFREIAFTGDELEELYRDADGGEPATLHENTTRYWTIKESVMKSLGIGLNVDLRDIEVRRDASGRIGVGLAGGALERLRLLGGNSVSVESFSMNGYVLSVARME